MAVDEARCPGFQEMARFRVFRKKPSKYYAETTFVCHKAYAENSRHQDLLLCFHDRFPSCQENKLFFEFIKGLEKFEHRNGLDHYRISSAHQRNGRRNNGGNDWTEETTVVHLGPMLKAAIRFYV